ncbi:MAG: energy-coupling factor transporter transmembrane protein EcfT [Anaerolineae bacterium]|nr:energy-coupling factor transporter transmembrane protein EcfT [Anaerolineae bacterium]
MSELLYVPGQGLLYRLDPRTKFLFVISVSACLILEAAPGTMLLILLGLHGLGMLSPGTRVRIVSLWKTMTPLIVTILVFGCLRWQANDALLAIGPITVTLQSVWQAIGLAVRIIGLSLCFSLALWTTELGDAVAGLTRLGLPFELGFPTVMALQQTINFRRVYAQILEAQQSRGLIVSHKNPIKAARAYIPVLVPLLINALRQADDLSLALQSRGFGVSRKRTSRRILRMKARDWLFMMVIWALLFALQV